jgi:RNA polymerase sigma-70 factor, ECF subfamily
MNVPFRLLSKTGPLKRGSRYTRLAIGPGTQSMDTVMNCTDLVPSISNNSDEPVLRQDDQLVSAAQRGSSQAFDELQRIYSRRLYRTIYSITKTPEDTEDALQDTFLRVYSSLCQFEGRSTIYPWLTRIAVNSALMILRKRRARSEILFDPNEKPGENTPYFDLRDAAPNPEEICDKRQRRVRLFHAIQNLEPSLRTPILMQMIQGWSVKQIGQALDISLAAVKARLHRARLRLSETSTLKNSQTRPRNSPSLQCRGHVKAFAAENK